MNQAFAGLDIDFTTSTVHGMSKGTIAGVVIGAIIGAGLLGFGAFYLFVLWSDRRKRVLEQSMKVTEPFKLESGGSRTLVESSMTSFGGRSSSRRARRERRRTQVRNSPGRPTRNYDPPRKGAPASVVRYPSLSTSYLPTSYMYTDSSSQTNTLPTASPVAAS